MGRRVGGALFAGDAGETSETVAATPADVSGAGACVLAGRADTTLGASGTMLERAAVAVVVEGRPTLATYPTIAARTSAAPPDARSSVLPFFERRARVDHGFSVTEAAMMAAERGTWATASGG